MIRRASYIFDLSVIIMRNRGEGVSEAICSSLLPLGEGVSGADG